jgi:hypothetical protein
MRGRRRPEFDRVADLGSRSLDRPLGQFEDASGVPANPGNPIFPKTAIHPHHPPITIEEQRVERKPHPEGMDTFARIDP